MSKSLKKSWLPEYKQRISVTAKRLHAKTNQYTQCEFPTIIKTTSGECATTQLATQMAHSEHTNAELHKTKLYICKTFHKLARISVALFPCQRSNNPKPLSCNIQLTERMTDCKTKYLVDCLNDEMATNN